MYPFRRDGKVTHRRRGQFSVIFVHFVFYALMKKHNKKSPTDRHDLVKGAEKGRDLLI